MNAKTIKLVGAMLLFLVAGLQQLSAQQKDFSSLVEYLQHPKKAKTTLVASHRGDWRQAPENSMQSLENVIKMGVDIYELDLKMTKDSVLILMHDKTIDRTVNQKGKPEDFTLAEIKTFYLRNGLGRATTHRIPTFEEFLSKSRGRILIDVDKGYTYFPQVLKLVQQLHMENQVIVNVDAAVTLEEVESTYGAVPTNIILMPVISLDDPDYKKYIDSFKKRKNTVFQPIFSKENLDALAYIKSVKEEGYHIWLNSLWPSLNAGHDDDTAVELGKPDETWGWLIKQGATILQTDRPAELLEYVDKK